MAANNLRIISTNLVDKSDTALTASSVSSASTPVSNMLSEYKASVWRSSTASTNVAVANLLVTLGTLDSIGGIVLVFSNLSASTTIRVRGYIGTTPTLNGTIDVPTITTSSSTLVFDSGFVVSNPPQGLGYWNFGMEPLGPTAQSPRKSYHRVWLPTSMRVPCKYITIEIVDPYNTDKFVEISRLIIGNYWSPIFNTSYGLYTQLVDTSDYTRTESGDVVLTAGIIYNTMSFDLTYMVQRDRVSLNSLVRVVGKRKPIFVSLFPDNSDDVGKEQIYQIYGRLSQLNNMEHTTFETYSSKLELEEI